MNWFKRRPKLAKRTPVVDIPHLGVNDVIIVNGVRLAVKKIDLSYGDYTVILSDEESFW